jgi:NTE family protein
MDIALALGGGGAKGNAHIGVLRLLEQEGIRVGAIAGTSYGGIVACFYAAGYTPDQIEDIFAGVDQTRLYDRDRDEPPAFLGLGRVRRWLRQTLGERTFESTRIPCAVTAVDMRTSTEIVIKTGPLRDAILCTIALPGVFPSYLKGELELVDGGLLNPVPVAVARSLVPSLPVVAVSLTTPLGEPAHTLPIPFLDDLPGPIAAGIGRLRITRAMEVFMRSIDIGSRQIAELRFKIEKPDVIIRPAVRDIGVLDQVEVREVARLGEEAARACLPEIRRAASWTSRLRRWAGGSPA